MSHQSNIVCGIQHLKLAMEYFEDFKRQHPDTKGANIFAAYNRKLDWILRDLITHTAFPQEVRDGIKAEINSDLMTVPAIAEKVALLNPQSREAVEELIDTILAGAEVIVENKKEE